MRVFVIPVLFAVILTGCNAGNSLQNSNNGLPVDCLIKPNPGSCRAKETRFYYDYRDNRCKPFIYSGCKGRIPFQTQKECSDHCLSGH
ncbi:BPTI/Kunitz domain-containing protein [Chromatium okenii]|jgi:hypothetical protein|uniref:Alpha-1-antitrypsin n=1 Tax=Chromatium okenii TaxID=61644 RepID=A0A2S7XNI8_9GAMM|nr:BPTI/Kunitz domain-containing protein [Chromatium okenii]MBV5309895.1 BPTI/Kunitz domain-containing protein [Chromatium okenii]PQJ94982.1 alpha-1-antitrypsin [Chromatium okenii]